MSRIRSTLAYASGILSSLLIVGSALMCQHSGAVAATDETKPPVAASAATGVAATTAATPPKKTSNGPSWQALTMPQQLALVPLAGEWDTMDSVRKEKWIVIGNKYGHMSTDEQNRTQARMRDWIKLTPEERRSVRQSYASVKKLNADQKSAQWEQYLQLSDEQKQQLAQQKTVPLVPATAVSRTPVKPGKLLPLAAPANNTAPIPPAVPAVAPVAATTSTSATTPPNTK